MGNCNIIKEAVYHMPYSEYCFGLSDREVVLRLRTKKGNLESVFVCWGDRMAPENPIKVTKTRMQKKNSDALFDYYEARLITWPITRLCYYFCLEAQEERLCYFNDVFAKEPHENRQLFYNFHYVRKEDIPYVPQWVYGAVAYQIYPDSFANGVCKMTPHSGEYTDSKGNVSKSKFGGTLRGLIDSLDYLQQLGVTLLYTTPIFASNSWHGYDTIDYFRIDSKWGTKEELKELVCKCHEKGMYLMLDGVFNHCSPDFFAFKDVLKQGKQSAYRDWFYIHDYPIVTEPKPNYECFAYVWTMPKLNTGNQNVEDYLVAVGKYWIEECDIDGWRLDVANEVNMDFWRRFRREVRACKKEVYLVGEIWDDAKAFLQGDQFDATMNYNLYFLCLDFFAKGVISGEDFSDRIQYFLTRYKSQIQFAQLNLLGSHDVPRFLTFAGGDERRLKNCALYLFTHVGIPMIYYGDELGMEGWHEEEYRKPMEWEKRENCLHGFYKQLITLRREKQNVFMGEFISLPSDNQTIAYFRKGEKGSVYVVINYSDAEAVRYLEPERLGENWLDYFTGQKIDCIEGKMEIKLEPLGRAVVVK